MVVCLLVLPCDSLLLPRSLPPSPPGLLDLAYAKQEKVVIRGALPSASQFLSMLAKEDGAGGKKARGRKRRRVAVTKKRRGERVDTDMGEDEEEEDDEEDEGMR